MASPATGTRRNSSLLRWGIVVAATAILAVASGGRFLIGVVFDQVREGFSLSHGDLGLVVSLSILVIGTTQPAVGWLVDRLQARFVAAGGLALLAIGLIITGRASSVWELVIGYCVFVALGLAAVSPVTVTPLVASWFVKRRATALSIVNAGGSVGQLAIVPGLTVLVVAVGWRDAYVLLGAGLFLVGVPMILWLLREREGEAAADMAQVGCSVRTALSHRSFWELSFGFFVCGFTMAWLMNYFVDYSLDQGISRETAGFGLSLVGGASILGTLITGRWADRRGSVVPLSVVYALRGLGFAGLLLAGSNVPLVLLALAVTGFSWSSTVPLTSALCADIYGRRALGTIFGLMFAIMPIGSAVGSALAGELRDLTGNYTVSLLANVAAGLLAAAVTLLVQARPIFARTEAPTAEQPAPVIAD
ncbi:MFS transporter [Sphaerobacter thermophilus]|jgi:MFS family permease|uniref:Major facilitator superfamily MFS_1 n=1 Tax=Sphaerobacter thermophilus (strain ATCC 49802 / DSM 20745 / KCCM 41009 / NCIMB 13125 / S 6022) TaxID=479434 RepID=D1C5U7_SPHTD|nr:MFS transporter [Sphaerobacter thermophilus]ACZ39499.1 major facilitator superfamily MFS_1 [Sphaerobacter thermophilus DSM 20745]PZN63468.1 MAG: MFS transporter [Sphaerobacter thermophilus]